MLCLNVPFLIAHFADANQKQLSAFCIQKARQSNFYFYSVSISIFKVAEDLYPQREEEHISIRAVFIFTAKIGSLQRTY